MKKLYRLPLGWKRDPEDTTKMADTLIEGGRRRETAMGKNRATDLHAQMDELCSGNMREGVSPVSSFSFISQQISR
jgi:hypothetical protein